MPFNAAMLISSGRHFILDTITSEDLALNYIVEAQLVSQFPASGGSQAGDVIQLTIEGINLVGSLSTIYTIDGDTIDDDAVFNITLETGAFISGRGGGGGPGGRGEWDSEQSSDFSGVGAVGKAGGTAMRFGCETHIFGTGTIENGYGGGGGGGGGATASFNEHGGGGGGGGAPLGGGGNGGLGDDGNGSQGGVATLTLDTGGGAAGGSSAGAGGRGGDSVLGPASGANGTKAGGLPGAVGDAIDSQGFTHSEAGGITVTGAII